MTHHVTDHHFWITDIGRLGLIIHRYRRDSWRRGSKLQIERPRYGNALIHIHWRRWQFTIDWRESGIAS